jgi:hypothetical protein
MALLDLLSDDLKENNLRILVQDIYQSAFVRPSPSPNYSRSPKNAVSSLVNVYALINRAIVHYEDRANTPSDYRITFTEEDVDKDIKTEIVTCSCLNRTPGVFGQSTPFEKDRNSTVKNLKFMLREEVTDPNNPGYNIATLGYWYDNTIRLTCWARTNKRANKRADWLESLMMEYMWFFTAEGISRIFYLGRQGDTYKEIDGNKWYGRPLDYFARTEKIITLSEKQIEEILVKRTLATQ